MESLSVSTDMEVAFTGGMSGVSRRLPVLTAWACICSNKDWALPENKWPISDQYSGHVICIDQSEASVTRVED